MWDNKPNSVSKLQTGHLATNLLDNPCRGCAAHDDYGEVDSDEYDYGNGGGDDDGNDGDDDGNGDDGDGDGDGEQPVPSLPSMTGNCWHVFGLYRFT